MVFGCLPINIVEINIKNFHKKVRLLFIESFFVSVSPSLFVCVFFYLYNFSGLLRNDIHCYQFFNNNFKTTFIYILMLIFFTLPNLLQFHKILGLKQNLYHFIYKYRYPIREILIFLHVGCSIVSLL